MTQDGSKSKEEAETQETQRTGSDIVDRQELVDYAKTLIGIKYKWEARQLKDLTAPDLSNMFTIILGSALKGNPGSGQRRQSNKEIGTETR